MAFHVKKRSAAHGVSHKAQGVTLAKGTHQCFDLDAYRRTCTGARLGLHSQENRRSGVI
jgi:hypothetical protein